MKNVNPSYIAKNEDIETYKRFAEEGMDLMFPVKVGGRSHRPDINIIYHLTIKLFDTTKDKLEHVMEVASKLVMNPPNSRKVDIEPTTLKGRTGNTMHVIRIHGKHADEIKDHHSKFAHLGYEEKYDFSPHITVDEETWNSIVNSKAKNAHEAVIEFMSAELRHKEKIIASYESKHTQEFSSELPMSEKMHIVRQTIRLNIDLQKHEKAVSLNDEFLANYLQDNPSLEKEVMEKYEKRLEHHFGDNKELIAIAWEKGLWEAYKAKDKK